MLFRGSLLETRTTQGGRINTAKVWAPHPADDDALMGRGLMIAQHILTIRETGAGEMPRGALSNITNNNGGAGRQQTREKQKVAGNQHADPAVPLRSNSSGETADAVSLRLPPTVPGRSPPRIVHAPGRLTDQDQDQDKDQGGGDACGSNDDGPWLGSIFSSAASSTRSSIVSPRDMDDFLARSAPSDAAAALRAMALQDNDENDELGARNDDITPLSTQQQKHLSSPAPQGYEDYAPESAEDGPEHSWWECDYCGLAFNTFDDASTHEAGCTLNQQHAAS